MSRVSTSPFVQAGLILAMLFVAGTRVRGLDLPTCSQEITRCLSICRAVCSRQLAEELRDAHMARSIQRSVATKSLK